MTKRSAIEWMQTAAASPHVSYANVHFPGLYRITCAVDDAGLRTRMYLAPPGALHSWLTNINSPFLWHRHTYDFASTTLLGTVQNQLMVLSPHGRTVMHQHRTGHDASGFRITPQGTAKTIRFRPSTHNANAHSNTYTLNGEDIHRVVFLPCERTGWFACLIRETSKADPAFAATAWSLRRLTEVPGQADLYKSITRDDVVDLLERMQRGHT